jgi:hyperosmotically inducible protein
MSRPFVHTAALTLLIVVTPCLAFAQTPARGASAAKPTDDEIEERIEYRLETNPLTKKYDIDVESDKAVVTLSGDVASEAQREEAGRLAKIDGVERVNNNIKVNKDADRTLSERAQSGLTKTGVKITDGWITTKVKWLLLRDEDTRTSDLTVDTKEQVVTLKGRAKSEAAHVRAIELAKRTDGVKRVVDQMESPANR